MVESDQSTEMEIKTETFKAEYREPGTEIQCPGCVYRRPVPGNAHIECVYNWTKALSIKKIEMIPLGHTHGVQQGWYMFPVLFDPIWMVFKCQAFSKVVDESYILREDKSIVQMVVLKYVLDHPLIVKVIDKSKSGGKEDVKIDTDKKPAESEDSGTGIDEERPAHSPPEEKNKG